MKRTPPRALYLIHNRAWDDTRIADALRIRGLEVEFRCHAAGDPLPDSMAAYRAVVIGGGSNSVCRADEYPYMARELAWTRSLVESGMPTFGICLGAQIIAAAFGGEVAGRPDGLAEFGFYPIRATDAGAKLFGGLKHVFHTHYEGCTVLPAEAELLATGETFVNQAFRIGEQAVGVQFHPDCRLDMVEDWYDGNDFYYGRPGVQSRADQLRLAPRYEPEIAAWLERFLDHWLAP